MSQLIHMQIRNPSDDETPIEAATQIFSAILPRSHVDWLSQWFSPIPLYSFEIYLMNQTIYYYMAIPAKTETFMTSLLTSSFPQCIIQKTTDPMDIMFKSKQASVGEVGFTSSYYYPIKTYSDFSIDPLSGVIGYLAKQNTPIKMGIQILVSQASFPWQRQAIAKTKVQPPKIITNPVTGEQTTETPPENPNAAMIGKKIMFQGGRVCIRVVAAADQPELPTDPYLQNLSGTFGTFSLAEGNQLTFRRPLFSPKKLIQNMKNRTAAIGERKFQILNAQELATLWHPPGKLMAGIRNIAWGKTLAGEPPENLPTTETVPEEEKKEVNFFAKTEFKNQESIFGIKTPDRRKHVYIVGKTGAGKSTLIANMAIDDIRRDRGVGIIDPHGDLCEAVLEYIPKRRINDVIYLEPFDEERPFSLNVLEIKNPQHRDLIASGIVAIFSKLYADSWGPRLEYILRNTIISLLELPQATLIDALNILSNEKFRKKAIEQIQDPVMVNFWTKEFNAMTDKLRVEAVSPIQNKVGQFVSSKKIRNIIGHPKSSINLEEIMDGKKILLLNLSQGKLGEDNAALLGAMIITQIQLAAMNRSFIKEEERQDFFLYVDEFQNFATSSFIKILSEARKYRLALTLTNQYIEQLSEDITHAIFGNVGTLVSFVVGARDADVLTKEFSEIYTSNDLVQLGKFETVMKICIDNMTSSPFPAMTLPPPALKNDNKDKIIRLSKEKYGRKITPYQPQGSGQDENNQPKPEKVQHPPSTPPLTKGGKGGVPSQNQKSESQKSKQPAPTSTPPPSKNQHTPSNVQSPVQTPNLGISTPTSNHQPPTSNNQNPTSNIQPPTSNTPRVSTADLYGLPANDQDNMQTPDPDIPPQQPDSYNLQPTTYNPISGSIFSSQQNPSHTPLSPHDVYEQNNTPLDIQSYQNKNNDQPDIQKKQNKPPQNKGTKENQPSRQPQQQKGQQSPGQGQKKKQRRKRPNRDAGAVTNS